MKLKITADQLDGAINAIVTNPKLRSDDRKKRLIVDTWNAYLGQQERYVNDDKLKSIYLSFEGTVTNTIAKKLTVSELHQFTRVITEDMRNSEFNNWKWRKKDEKHI